jgi:hypothetical protein
MQTEFSKVDGGANGIMENAPQELADGDEVITIRYDFYKYAGPLDPESGEVETDNVGPDDLHGIGIKNINGVDVDFSTIIVVGDYIGAQMAGFDAAGQIGLIDHLQDGEINVPYVDRSMVIGGTPPIVTTLTGPLPDGMTFDAVTGIVSGTPTQAGLFTFTLHSTDAAAGDVTMTYDLTIADSIVVLPHYNVGTTVAPLEGGLAYGAGDYEDGALATVSAEASPGYQFLNWTENGTIVSTTPSYSFVVDVNRDLVANFELIAVETYAITTSSSPVIGGNTSGAGTYEAGTPVTVVAVAAEGYTFESWSVGGIEVSIEPSYTFTADADYDFVANFALIPTPTYAVSTSAAPAAGGATSGGGTYDEGDTATVVAVANPHYGFLNWTEGSTVVSNNPSYVFTVNADRNLVANFIRISYVIEASASPGAGGSTTGGGTVYSGDSVTMSAVASTGYEFTNWTEGGSVVSSLTSYTFTASANRNLVANFSLIPPVTYSVTTSASPSAGGTTSGGGTVNSGDTVTVVAVANVGYSFVSWTESGSVVSSSASYSFTVSANRNLVANFTPVATGVSVKMFAMCSPVVGGTKAVGIVMLAAPAPAGGVTVKLTSSNTAVLRAPASVTIPAGKRVAGFLAATSPVRRSTNVSVTAAVGSSSKTLSVKVIRK